MPVKKPAAKKAAAKKPAVKKAAAKWRPGKKAPAKKPAAKKAPSGFHSSSSGRLLIPNNIADSIPITVVEPSRLQRGIQKAKKEILSVFSEMADIATKDFHIDSMDFTLSFKADGSFLGFGVGGAMSVKITIKPEQ